MQRPQDEELLALFHLMDSEEREFYLQMGRVTTAGRERRPVLSIVPTDSRVLADVFAFRRSLG